MKTIKFLWKEVLVSLWMPVLIAVPSVFLYLGVLGLIYYLMGWPVNPPLQDY